MRWQRPFSNLANVFIENFPFEVRRDYTWPLERAAVMSPFPDRGRKRAVVAKVAKRLKAALYNEEKSTVLKQESRPKGRLILISISNNQRVVARQ